MRRAVPCILVACLAVWSTATPSRAESIFNLNLVGERLATGDVRATALGGSMQLLDDSLSVLQFNPAMLTYHTKVTFGAAQYLSSDLSRSGSLEEQEVASKFTDFMFAFPLFNRFTVGLGFRGRYDTDASLTIRSTSSAGEAYRDEFIRSGGLSSYPLSIATNVTRFFKVGAFYTVETGSIENRWNVIFDAPDQRPSFSIQKRTLSGNGWGVGVVVRPVARVLLGLTYEGEIDYDVSVREFFTNSAANGSFDEDMTLPARWVGAAQWRGEDFAVYAGASLSDFERFEGLDFPANRLQREEMASLGVEYLNGVPVFGRRFPLRLSIAYERLPYEYPEGERVQRVVGGVGTGLKFRDGKGKIDFALQTGKTGSRDGNGLETRILRLYVGVSGAELWKRHRESAY
jgi:hypothetical protein